jgi:LmbE family N-acetylglucosaminyl deacetylase
MLTLGWSDTPRGRTSLRKLASGAMRACLRLRSRVLQAGTLRSFLVVSPHPDDEALGCGGLIALSAGGGAPVYVAYVTDGAASHPRHPRVSSEDLAQMRKREAREATAILGVEWTRVSFLGAPDGRLSDLDPKAKEEIAVKIAILIKEVTPDAILLPCRRDGSDDHGAAFRIVQLSLLHVDRAPRILEFPIWSWRNPMLLLRPLFTSRAIWRVELHEARIVKANAIHAYASQVTPLSPDELPVLSADFTAQFTRPEEYLFET